MAVDIQDLRVVRGPTLALDGLTATVASGAVTGLLGPSGSGKTTLMRAVVGIQRVASGRVVVLGRPAGSPVLRRLVGYVPQEPSVYGDLTVEDNLGYFAALLDVPESRVRSVIDLVGLGSRRRQVVDRLSGGERGRVSLAAALLGEPPLLVLDEPTVGLDPVLRRDLWSTFHQLAAEGTTLLVSSHVMEEAANCDQLLLLRGGRGVFAGTPARLRTVSGTRNLGEAFLRIATGEGQHP